MTTNQTDPGTVSNGAEHRRQSRHALDALSFFIADAQTGFGPYIATFLIGHGWSSTGIGDVLGIGTLAALVSQLPGGALVDRLHDKRLGAAVAWIAMAVSAVLFVLAPGAVGVAIAEILHSFSTAMLAPAIAAISLGLVGRKTLGERLGRNARFAAIGNAATAALLGAAGAWIAPGSVFWITAAFVLPGVYLLWRLPHPKIGPGQPDEPSAKPRKTDWRAVLVDLRGLLTQRGVLAFSLCVALFHLSNAAIMPLAGTVLARTAGAQAPLFVSACVIGPQAVVALLSPWVGRTEERRGVRLVLLGGYAAVPLRAALLAGAATLHDWAPYAIAAVQVLDGVSAAVFGVSLPVMAADLTKGSNRFNLCLGFFGIAITAGATLGNTIAGRVADALGEPAAFGVLAAFGLAAVASVLFTVRDGAGVSARAKRETPARA